MLHVDELVEIIRCRICTGQNSALKSIDLQIQKHKIYLKVKKL
jgi:hypothetical protein